MSEPTIVPPWLRPTLQEVASLVAKDRDESDGPRWRRLFAAVAAIADRLAAGSVTDDTWAALAALAGEEDDALDETAPIARLLAARVSVRLARVTGAPRERRHDQFWLLLTASRWVAPGVFHRLLSIALREIDDRCEVAERAQALGQWLRDADRVDDAITVFEQGLKHFTQHHGRNFSWTSFLLTDLAGAYAQAGRAVDAEQAYCESLAIAVDLWGDEHRQVHVTLSNLGTLWLRTGRGLEAYHLWCDLLPRRAALCGATSEEVQTTAVALGDLCVALGFVVEAEAHMRTAVRVSVALDWFEWPTRHTLAAFLSERGRDDEAESVRNGAAV
jgi:hypothetical protein